MDMMGDLLRFGEVFCVMVYMQPVIDAIQYYSAFYLGMHYSIYDIAVSVTKN